MKYLPLISAHLLLFSVTAFAFGTSGSLGCCGISPGKTARAEQLLAQLSHIPSDQLDLRLVLGEICAPDALDCGSLSEEDARRVIENHLARTATWWDRIQKIVLASGTVFAIWLGLANRYRPRRPPQESKE